MGNSIKYNCGIVFSKQRPFTFDNFQPRDVGGLRISRKFFDLNNSQEVLNRQMSPEAINLQFLKSKRGIWEIIAYSHSKRALSVNRARELEGRTNADSSTGHIDASRFTANR